MASNSGFTRGLPSGQSKVSTTDEEFRSVKSYVETWLEAEHYVMGGSANSAGVHRLGSGRAFVMATTSQLSNPTGDNGGRLGWVSANNGLYVADASNSTWTIVTSGIATGSAVTWTARHEFTSDVSVNDLAVGGAWAQIVSGSSTLASDRQVDASGSLELFLENPSGVTNSDPILVGFSDHNSDLLAAASVHSSTGSIAVNFVNRNAVSDTTLGTGSVIRWIAFRNA